LLPPNRPPVVSSAAVLEDRLPFVVFEACSFSSFRFVLLVLSDLVRELWREVTTKRKTSIGRTYPAKINPSGHAAPFQPFEIGILESASWRNLPID
jgi:hypothetical protein